ASSAATDKRTTSRLPWKTVSTISTSAVMRELTDVLFLFTFWPFLLSTCYTNRRLPCADRSKSKEETDVRSSFLFLILRLQLRHHRRVRQRRGITQRASLRNVAQQPPHDLAGTRLRQVRRKQDLIRPRNCPDLVGDVLLQLC